MKKENFFRDISLPKSRLDDIGVVAKFYNKIPKIIKSLLEIGPIKDFHDHMDKIASDSEMALSDASNLFHVLLRLISLRNSLDISSSILYEVITINIEGKAPNDWKKINLQKWRKSKKQLIEALEVDGILSISHKAILLTVSYQNLFRESNIITDIRPIFNTNADEFIGSTITHKLQIEYYDGKDRNTMYFTLDSKDIAKLKKLCERAEKKSKVLKDLTNKLPGQTIIIGEN